MTTVDGSDETAVMRQKKKSDQYGRVKLEGKFKIILFKCIKYLHFFFLVFQNIVIIVYTLVYKHNRRRAVRSWRHFEIGWCQDFNRR